MHVTARTAIPAILPNPASAVRSDNAAQPQVTPGGLPTGVPGADKAASQASADRAPLVSQVALSPENLDALQSVDNGDTALGKSASSPAHEARAFIADHPEFADVPFGHVVSQFARGGTPTLGSDGGARDSSGPSSDATDVSPPTDVVDVPPSDITDTASNTPTDTTPADTTSNTDTPTDVADLPPSDTTDTGSTPPTDVAPTDVADLPPSDTSDTASNPPPVDTSTDTAPTDPGIAANDPTQDLIDALTA